MRFELRRQNPIGVSPVCSNLSSPGPHAIDELGIAGTRDLVERHITPVAISRPLPAALGGATAASVTAGASVF